MTCLCFSDSHGVGRFMREALSRHSDAEVVFFLGDGLSDIEKYIELDRGRRAWIFVRGNRDVGASVGTAEARKVESITLEGKKIVLTHGDLYGTYYGFDGLLRLAENSGAEIVLYGHTHTAAEKYIPTANGGVYLFNPGTVGGIREEPSYGVLTLSEKGALFSIMRFD